jgi:hypothetical protein
VWFGATPRAFDLSTRLRRGDLDSEGQNERSFFVELPPPRVEARARVSCWGDEPEPKNNESVLGVWGWSRAPTVLADKPDRADDSVDAVVVSAHAWGRC